MEIAFGAFDSAQIHIFGKAVVGVFPEPAAEVIIADSDIGGDLIHGKIPRKVVFDIAECGLHLKIR